MLCPTRAVRCFAALLFSIGCSLAFAQNDGSAAKTGPIVVLITIDGFPARALKDPKLPMATLRQMMADGAYADEMTPINPTVTWPNHTTLVTGVDASVHHVMANGRIDMPAQGTGPVIHPAVPKADLVHARTLYEAAAEKGMTTGQVDWVAVQDAKGIAWQFGEKPQTDSPIVQDLIRQGTLSRDEAEHFYDSMPAWRDEMWTDAAIDILSHHTPNLLLVHLLQTDTLQHQYGAMSSAAYAAFAYADHCLARMVEAAKEAGVGDRTTFLVASDHGFGSVQHAIRPNVMLAKRGILAKQGGHDAGGAWFLAEGGETSLYITDRSLVAKLVPEVTSYFAALPGVDGVYSGDELKKLGLPLPGTTDQAPDLYITAKPGFAFWSGEDGPETQEVVPASGSHGYSNLTPDMQALFVAYGAGIRRGVRLGRISNLTVAPTIARLLGLSMPEATALPLHAALR